MDTTCWQHLETVRPFIDTSTHALKVYGALIQPHFDYCGSVWDDLNITLNDKLQKLQYIYRAARVIIKSPWRQFQSISKLVWDNLSKCRKKHKAILMLKIVLNTHCLGELFESRSTRYNLRNLKNTLFVPKTITKEVLVRIGQCCGKSCLKVYEQYPL